MRRILLLTAVLFSALTFAQDQNGSIAGKILDKEMNNDPLPFANVQLAGTTKGTTTDFDGLYELTNIAPGTYTVVVSFVGYETLQIPGVVVEAGKVTEVNTTLGAGSVSLDEVVVTTTVRRDSETALLLDQKKAVEIKESIGAQQLTKIGVSDAATATTKISGVTSSEGSGDVFIRGLGDRYLSTTLNGLPIPSDDVNRKNIDLGLFPTRVIQNVGISKTYSVENVADQASGTVDVSSRELVGDQQFSVRVRGGANTNVLSDGVADNFKVSPMEDDVTLGFYDQKDLTFNNMLGQSWNTQTTSAPYNGSVAITAGKKIGEKLKLFFTGSQSASHQYREGTFKQFDQNFLDDSLNDVTEYNKNVTTSGLFDATYAFDYNNKIKFNTLLINTLRGELYEAGRDGKGLIFEETNPAEGLSQFIRDQNIKQTRLWVTQLSGTHPLFKNNQIDWAIGYNRVDADEPNRIRNEVNFNEEKVQLARTGGFQQRKSLQKIGDDEYNAKLKDVITFKDEDDYKMALTLGGSFRYKERNFVSQVYGVEEAFTDAVNPPSIDDLGSIFIRSNFANQLLSFNVQSPDRYEADLQSIAGFASFNLGLDKWNFNLGARFQDDDLKVVYNVGNIPGRIGENDKAYQNIYPSFNVKYTLGENSALRFATSRTITLPEFKEIAPFEYVSQTGQITRGNPDLEASTNFNYDLKWEYFPSRGELISLAAFYKEIQDPINRVITRGASNIFSYFNTSEKAEVFGLEFESRLDLLKSEEEKQGVDLGLSMNATRMWHNQDLKENVDPETGRIVQTFRYKGKTETGLQGAADWIFNGTLNFEAKSENPFTAALTANYSSDKIFSLGGAPLNQQESETEYNDEIIEKGFVTLDLVLGKRIGEHWNLQLRGLNLLNPDIQRTQFVKPNGGVETNEIVRSYTNGSVFSLGVQYDF
ncbi:TonB-dependent receptor [Robertkochia sediminum]|uniref:TonB-dependent receptor n=1 Tax=Robertkochia sediminum TaxID=2785326 RepID=UPI00193194ED|nr:TonB-dependent receptor [Robertkochia sediminum]MBL7474002.1 TonB-dependent receptor [Robertkochia sediminum]